MNRGIRFNLPEKLYLRDPQESKYGKRLLSHAVELMEDIGFEAFNFRKLAEHMSSTEASVYRYFENKHLLLLYLNCWYWEWVHYLIDINTRNLTDAAERLERGIHCMIYASTESSLTDYVNENLLHQLIINEGTKSYHIHDVDKENKEGLFLSYKELVEKVAQLISDVNPAFPYARTLASTLFEMINDQIYFAEHLPRLSDLKKSNKMLRDLENMIIQFVNNILSKQVSTGGAG